MSATDNILMEGKQKCYDLSLAWGSAGVSLASSNQVLPVCTDHHHLLAPVVLELKAGVGCFLGGGEV